MSEISKKNNRGSNWTNGDNGVTVTGDDKSRILQNVMDRSALFNPKIGRPYKYEPEEVEERAKGYFMSCVEHGCHPTLTGLANGLDISYDTLLDWERDKSKPFHNTIQRAKMLIRDYEEQAGLEGKMNTILSIFRSKAIWGFVEESRLSISANSAPDLLTPTHTVEEIQAQYLVDDD